MNRRNCWIAYGYDPRHTPDARLFQVLDLRLPTELDSLVPRKSEKADVAFPRRLRPLGAVCITLGSLRWRVGSDPFVAVCR